MDYLEINRKLWNDKTEVHVNSQFYDVDGFLRSENSLKHVEIDLLGDISGKKVLHLQCHFGMDTISMCKLGAEVTGVDLSNVAIEEAKNLNKKVNSNARFILSDIYNLPNVHDEKYDVVFTSYGTIGWLPDIDKWASIVVHFLKSGGEFLIVDFHPVLWMMDDEFSSIKYSYFNDGPIIEQTDGSYADRNADISNQSVSWNHPLGEIIQSLIKKGLTLHHFEEYNYSVYDCFENTIEIATDKFQIKGLEGIIPMMYSIKCNL